LCEDSVIEALILDFYYQDRRTNIVVGIFTEKAAHELLQTKIIEQRKIEVILVFNLKSEKI